ncbi:RagB/SusD family nutrient uptake outer membrane protein [Saccharicrinis sp. FJH54]|uniref:RagB/SusD family nutrient uptake outer membrane protein n=1 Tax=Saccharicrinis sp. FJH54 TaxID=3344665 RepID=UPI0035D4EA04
MKHYIKISTILSILIIIFSSCQELSMEQDTGVTDGLMWNNPTYIDRYMVDLISEMPNGFSPEGFSQGELFGSATDEAENANPLAGIQNFNSGNWNAVSHPDNIWIKYYHAIYKANLFLKKTKNTTYDTFEPANRQVYLDNLESYKSEARFLRALYYYELIKRYGAVVLVGDNVVEDISDLSNSAFDATRSPFVACAKYIINECDYLIDNELLPLLDEGADQGRPNGTAVKALKCKTYLLMASPAYNSAVTEGSEQQKVYWKEVLDIAQDIAFDRVFTFGPYDQFDGTSPEIILGYRQADINYIERVNFPVGSEGVNATGSTNPTQNLVDAYRMLNGKKIDDPDSGYDPANPYVNRDQRLLHTVIVNGSNWDERNAESRIIEIFKGGRDGMDRAYGTKTGYYLRKFLDPTLDLRQDQTSNREWPVFRFADIVLIWAEAANELYGPSTLGESYLTATTLLNQTVVRHGGLPEIELNSMTQAEMRDRIREERFIEFAFEDQRAWDLRRWGIAVDVLSQPVYKMEVTKNADGTYSYQEKELEKRYFEERMNLYPIPQSEINNGLSQNPGW